MATSCCSASSACSCASASRTEPAVLKEEDFHGEGEAGGRRRGGGSLSFWKGVFGGEGGRPSGWGWKQG